MIDEDFILHGPELPTALPEISFGAYCFDRIKNKDPNFIILVEAETGREYTSKEFLESAVNIATGLRNIGIGKGDVVCIIGSNKFDISVAAAATLFIGAVMTPLDVSYKAYEYQHMLGLVEPKVVLCDNELIEEVQKGLNIWGGSPPVYSLQDGMEDYAPLMSIAIATDLDSFEPEQCDDIHDVCLIVGSSGSTGLPKAVGLTHVNLHYQIFLQGRLISILPNPRFLQTSFFFWISSVVAMVLSFCADMTRIVLREIEDVTVMQATSDYKPNWTLIPPSLLNAIVHHPDFSNYDFSSLLAIITGGSPLQMSTVEVVREKFGPRLILGNIYGLSELTGALTSFRPDFDIKSIGTCAPGSSLKIIDVETGATLPPEHEGEICSKSLGLMKCYIKNPEATEECIDEDGWFHTGDLGHFTTNGAIYITGRMKELMKLDNHQIAPAEIEDVINAVPGVADVGVAGIKISEDSSHPMALVVKEEGSDVSEEEIIKAVNENLSDHKQLRAGVCFVDQIPRNATGKIVRRLLNEMATELYMGDTQSIF